MGISRRDFLNGSLLALGALAPLKLYPYLLDDDYYPPLLSGFRGSHPGSFESMHDLAWGGRSDWGGVIETKEEYDLVIVGAGISGLSAAYFYKKLHNKDAKILIIDNHDDFGGHAQRNEFRVGKKRIYGYAGSQSMESPDEYSDTVLDLLEDIGVDFDEFEDCYDLDFYSKHNLRAVTHFDKKSFGTSKVVPFLLSQDIFYEFPGLISGELDPKDAIMQMPISAKDELKRVLGGSNEEFDDEMPYFEYLKKRFDVKSKEVFELLRYLASGDFGYGADAISAKEAKEASLPGFKKIVVMENSELLAEQKSKKAKQYIHHYPDGNATVARLLVKKLIPSVANFKSASESISTKFDYKQLDIESSRVRIRLKSTVINVQNSKNSVETTYFKEGKAYRVRAKKSVMACYNMAIPHIIPTLPQSQKDALKKLVKAPLVYTNVLLDSWSALKNLGIGYAYSPGRMHKVVALDYPVSMGGYTFVKSPNEPVLLHLEYLPLPQEYGKEIREQFKDGRYKLLGMAFEDFESEIKEHLFDLLGGGGFDPNKNIKAITVNRWSHGYSYSGSALYDPDMSEHKRGRKKFGNIVIANSDAGASAYLDSSIEQAYRAINEL